MRVVLFPVISSRFVPAAPSLNFAKAFVESALARDPEAVFYLVLPDDDESAAWQYGGEVIDLPRTHVVKVPMYRSQFDELFLVTREFWDRFNERLGDLWFDAILCERPALAPMLKKLAEFHVDSKSRQVTVVNRSQIVMKRKWFGISSEVEFMEVLGTWSSPTIFQSPHQRDEAFRVAREYLKPAQMRTLMEQAVVFPLGIDCDDVDATNMAERDQKHEMVTVNYSHKLFGEQKFVESLAIMDSTFAGGRPIQLQIVTGSSGLKMVMMKKAVPFSYIRTVDRADRVTFLKEMAKAHVFVSNSVYEDFSATVVEQLYTGLVPVLIDKPWSRYLLPDGYPYLFADSAEGQGMLRYVVDHVDEIAAEWVPRIREKIRAEFDLKTIAAEMYSFVGDCRIEDMASARVSPSMSELVDEVWADLPAEFGVPEIASAVRRHSESMDLNKEAESKSTSRWLFVDVLIGRYRCELVDLGDLVPRWRKR